MIIWLASYPKSGNTILRALLASYLFTNDGIFNFELLKNIHQFPDTSLFKNQGIDVSNDEEVLKNYIKVQEVINKVDQNKIRLLKTHSTLHDVGGYPFTNLSNTLGVIHIVRDPRNVVNSYANHYQETLEEAAISMTSFKILVGSKEKISTHLGSWDSHYNVWKTFNKTNKYLLVKYEDLLQDKKNKMIEILKFFHSITSTKFVLDEVKLNNAIETTSFEKMKALEKKIGFPEAVKNKKNEPINFFNLGPKNNWDKILPENIKSIIEKSFKKEMEELGYL